MKQYLAASVLAALTTLAQAHGDEDHARKAGPVDKTQQEWGVAAEATKGLRTIDVRMGDNMRFTPDFIEVQQGETLRLRVHNDGKLLHEFVLGTQAKLDEHAALMLKFPGMEHDEPYMAHVKPGTTGEIVWTFNRAGDFHFACLIAGHYQAGMVGKIRVLKKS